MHPTKLRPRPVPEASVPSVDGHQGYARHHVYAQVTPEGTLSLVMTSDGIEVSTSDGHTLARFTTTGFEVLHQGDDTPFVRRVAPMDLSDWTDFRFATRDHLGFDVPPGPPPSLAQSLPDAMTQRGGTGLAVTRRV